MNINNEKVKIEQMGKLEEALENQMDWLQQQNGYKQQLDMGQEIHTQQQKLVNKFNQVRQKMARNRLILVSILNLLTFLSFLFAMAFYQWILIELQFGQIYQSNQVYYFWINLLYLRQNTPNAEYENFGTAQRRICKVDIYCKATFYSFAFVGYLCFAIFVIAGCLQMFDFIKMFCQMIQSKKLLDRKDNFRHVVTIITYTVGLTLSAFSIAVTHERYKFGVSFWLCVGTLIVFILVIIYEQISIRKMIKQSLIQELLDREVQARAKKIKQTDIQMQRVEQKQQGLTL